MQCFQVVCFLFISSLYPDTTYAEPAAHLARHGTGVLGMDRVHSDTRNRAGGDLGQNSWSWFSCSSHLQWVIWFMAKRENRVRVLWTPRFYLPPPCNSSAAAALSCVLLSLLQDQIVQHENQRKHNSFSWPQLLSWLHVSGGTQSDLCCTKCLGCSVHSPAQLFPTTVHPWKNHPVWKGGLLFYLFCSFPQADCHQPKCSRQDCDSCVLWYRKETLGAARWGSGCPV